MSRNYFENSFTVVTGFGRPSDAVKEFFLLYMAKKSTHSIEEQVEFWCKSQLQGKTRVFAKTESINPEIDKALKEAPSKSGGQGTNYPDLKCFMETPSLRRLPVMIEVKGTKGALVKLDKSGVVANMNNKGVPQYDNIAKYAVNGAVHYGHAILNHSESYDEVISVGVNGYDLPNQTRKYEVEVYYISKQNLFVPIRVGDFSDLSFLFPEYQAEFIATIDNLQLSDSELEAKKLDLEDDIERKLKAINQKMEDDLDIVVGSRVKLITGLVMAGLGVPKRVAPLRVDELSGELGTHSNDGVKIMNKISDYLSAKNIPAEKIEMIEDVLGVVFLHSHLERPENGESKLRKLYIEVKNNILPFLSTDLHNIDFTGRLFNVLNDWVDVPDGAKNDVVLTPRYVTELMASLCSVNKDSYVWDFATGSGGFLISAMHQMIADAKKRIKSPSELENKILHIKMAQLMGIEKLPDIYMLAVLNMILMKDGSANLIHGDSLRHFEGLYEQGEHRGEVFPATVFLLNPPYSADGKGMVFVDRALSMMSHGGMAAILIQENAGRGQGLPYTVNVLANNTLIASIKMSDIFCGKASVSTAIYVFRIGVPHDPNAVVKFIDFSNDGYQRQNRKKSSQSVNLRDIDHAQDRYAEIIKLVKFGRGVNDENLHYYTDCYIEDKITLSGADWTYRQHKPVDVQPDSDDFKLVVRNYIKWLTGTLMDFPTIDYPGLGFKSLVLNKEEKEAVEIMSNGEVKFNNFIISKFFDIHPTKSYGWTNDKLYKTSGLVPVVCNSSVNNGIGGWVALKPTETGVRITYSDTTTSDAIFYQPFDFVGYSHVQGFYPYEPDKWDEDSLLYFVACFRKSARGMFDYADKFTRELAGDMVVSLPLITGSTDKIDFALMKNYISALKKTILSDLKSKMNF